MTDEQRHQLVTGIPEDDLRSDAEKHYIPYLIWVEKADIWVEDPSDPMGGTDIPIERLIFNCEISETYEPIARHALESFLAPGKAMDRINAEFAPKED